MAAPNCRQGCHSLSGLVADDHDGTVGCIFHSWPISRRDPCGWILYTEKVDNVICISACQEYASCLSHLGRLSGSKLRRARNRWDSCCKRQIWHAGLALLWIGAIPAMVFLALFMLPIYRHSRALTVPDFLRIRYNDATHILSASCLGVMMALIAGVGLYAISSVLHLFFGWSFFWLILLISGFVLSYVVSGGLKATIYNEVFQFTLTIVGLVPLMIKVLRDFHGIGTFQKVLPYGMTHIWDPLPLMRPRTAPLTLPE